MHRSVFSGACCFASVRCPRGACKMGGGNGQKSATKRARNLEKLEKPKGSQLKSNAAAMTLKCQVCLTQFICTSKEQQLKDHQENKHPKSTFEQCFPGWKQA
eukprot:GHUV01001268.1.p1 GENE.GHUV01001268.1~~GHUV01001268.1.p1  ORF type:complete len:102 (+),score=15.99 GHUV01001268.1:121-426(+)